MDSQPDLQAYLAHAVNQAQAIRTSIIIVNYNGREDLEVCLPALIPSLPDDCEIILVDNASDDGSEPYIKANFPAVRVIRSETNLGFGGGNNLGAEQANGEILVFLNPDTTVEMGWLEPLVHVLKNQSDVGLVTPKILLMSDPDRINTCGNDVHLTGLTLCRGMGMSAATFNNAEEISAVSGAAFAVRKTEFIALGGFDPTFFMYMEDTDLSLRYQFAGYRCLFSPESIIYHEYRLRFGPSKTYFQEANRYAMLLKNLRWRTLLILLPALLLAEGITWGFVVLRDRGNFGNKFRAYFSLIRRRDQILTGRRKAQSRRKISDRELLAKFTTRLDFEQTGGGVIIGLAAGIFNPIFALYRPIALLLIRW